MKKIFLVVVALLNFSLAASIDITIEKEIERPLLYAPWRDNYDKTVNNAAKYQNNSSSKECPFCLQCNAGDDRTYFILYRAKYNFIMMNAYPYSRGHLLVIPYCHISGLSDHPRKGRAEMIELTNTCIKILKKKYNYEGFNIGFNLGAIAGASIPGHLHMQIIPREKKNAAFIELIGKASVVNFKMQTLYQELISEFKALT